MTSARERDVSGATPQSLEEACIAKGMRMTEQRRVIARVLEASADHPDVEELYKRSAGIDPNISISTVRVAAAGVAGSPAPEAPCA